MAPIPCPYTLHSQIFFCILLYVLSPAIGKERMTPDHSEKAKALDLALAHIERQFGRGSLMRLGAAGACAEAAVLPTGSLALDAALGIGGIPRGRITEIYGPEASG